MAARIETIGVVGAGTMGAGIAQLAVVAGFETLLHDPVEGAVEKAAGDIEDLLNKGAGRGRWSEDDAAAAIARLSPAAELEDLAGCGLIIEAVPEDLELKRSLFADLTALLADSALLATNTSSISVTAIAATTPRPQRVVGMHFFNPPPRMRLLEIVAGDETSVETVASAREVGERMGRTPIDAADGIGFLANRLARPYTLESLRMVAEGFEVETIDAVCRTLGGFRMGPFELIDLVGVDVNLGVAKSFWEQSFHEPRWQPSPIQQRLVDAGRLGRKSGRGFYDYRDGPHRPDDKPDPPPSAPPLGEILTGATPGWVRDREEEILGRILAGIVNEAYFAFSAGVGSIADSNTAMRLGFNWPRGPFEWAEAIGHARALAILDVMQRERGEERYRAAPALRALAASAANLT